MAILKTIKIKDPDQEGEYLIINEQDFDPDSMEKFGRQRKGHELSLPTVEEVAEAIRNLDESNENNWTASGSAQITALELAMPGKKITAAIRNEAEALLAG